MSNARLQFTVGQRVQLHAATDEFMQGDRFGVVVGFGRSREYVDRHTGGRAATVPARVKLDRSGRVRRFHPDNLFSALAQSAQVSK